MNDKYYVKATPKCTDNNERKLVVIQSHYEVYPASLHNGLHFVLMVTEHPTLFQSFEDAENAIEKIIWNGSEMDFNIIKQTKQ